jgi:hypothetical protein
MNQQLDGEIDVIAQPFEIGSNQDLQILCRWLNRFVGGSIGGFRGIIQIRCQKGLVDLHIFGTGLLEFSQQLDIHRQETAQ